MKYNIRYLLFLLYLVAGGGVLLLYHFGKIDDTISGLSLSVIAISVSAVLLLLTPFQRRKVARTSLGRDNPQISSPPKFDLDDPPT